MKQLFLKKLMPLCAVAMLTATTNANATESVNLTEMKISAEKPPVSDIPFFKGHRQGRGVTLQWVANNVESFEILYSTDNDYYESLEMVSAKSQTTSGAKNGRYTLTIPDVYPGETFYKLKGTLADGSVVYSEPISVMIMKRK